MVATAKKRRNSKSKAKRMRGLGQELAAIRKGEGVKNRGLRNRKLLVINRDYVPISTTTLKRAVKKVWNELAVFLLPPGDDTPIWQEMTWADWRTLEPREGEDVLKAAAKRVFRIPEIIKVNEYSGVPNRRVKLSRRALFRRDSFRCQYCGEKPGIEELTLDHVLPKAQGGKTTWENMVVACVECNQRRKDNKTPAQAGMKLLREPYMPQYDVLQGRMIRVDSWQHFLGDCYWMVPLKD